MTGAGRPGPLRVLIDAGYALRAPVTGTAVYLDALCAALRDRDDILPIPVADRRRGGPGAGSVASVRHAARDAWWVQSVLPALARRHRADVIHHALPAWSRRARCAQVITVHDLAFVAHPDWFAPRFRRWAVRAHRTAALRADAVICVSEATRTDLRHHWPAAAARAVVVAHGPGQPLVPVPRAAAPIHFLYVGDDEPRKRLGLLLEAHRRYRAAVGPAALPLVLAGRARARQDGVTVVAHPDRRRLSELHAGAAALVHAAGHEGFGLTLVEAMAAGTPVLAVRGAAVAEVCGAAAWLVAADADALAAGMQALAGDPARREALSRHGRERAGAFSWERCAAGHAEVYARAAAMRH
ncbi:MAG TPA: glycosyltransferase family 1 protein [Solirubrobacteraceae bacterium]|nr:glycosyltransferase family 1 protein [Solirubrobacteraceae bacterium]